MQGRRTSKPTEMIHRARIVWMWASGKSVRDIAQENGTSITTVYRWNRPWTSEGTINTRPRTGRPRITTVEEDTAILEAVHTQPQRSAVDVSQTVQPRCSLKTVQRRIQERQLRQSALTNRNRTDGLTYGGTDGFGLGNHVVQYNENTGLNENNFASVTNGSGHENTFSSVTNGSGGQTFWSQNMWYEASNRHPQEDTCKVNFGMWGFTYPNCPGLTTYQS